MLGIIAFGLFLYYWPAVRAVLYPAVEPGTRGYGILKSFGNLVPSFVSTYVTTHKDLYERNAELEREIEVLENKIAERDAAIREYNLSLSGSVPEAEGRVVVLYPIMEDKTNLYSTIILSKGFKDGVPKNAIVYVRGQQAVCEIVEVYDRTSLCELLSKGGRQVEGVTSSSSVVLTLAGMGGGDFTADLPKGTPITQGETVYLRSNQVFVLGTVVSVQDDDQATGMRIFVRGAYNPADSSVFYMNTAYVR